MSGPDAPTPETHTVRSVDLPLGAGRSTLRVSVMDGPGGDRVVTLAPGFGGGDSDDPFLRPDWLGLPLQLPASIIPALRDALAALESE
jgi:hypothetical protein